jgi:NADPH2:quinone reductase
MAGASDTAPAVRAARLHELGQPLIVEEVQLPAPADGEVRVELEFGGVNPIDTYVAQGRVSPDGPLPRTLGGEAAGTAKGRPVLVAGESLGSARDGVWAQAAVVPEQALTPLPDGVSSREAAAMGIAGLTALKVVRDLARVTAGDRVLVLGASGGVGSMIVSLAHAAGATVWGQTGSSEKAGGIVEQGAERAIVAGPDELGEQLGDLEPSVAFDPLGDGFVAPILEAMAPRGRIVSLGTSAGPEVAFNMQVLYRKMISLLGYGGMQLHREERQSGLQAALRALADGSIRVRIDEVVGLADVNYAFARLRERGVQGKLLLDLG